MTRRHIRDQRLVIYVSDAMRRRLVREAARRSRQDKAVKGMSETVRELLAEALDPPCPICTAGESHAP